MYYTILEEVQHIDNISSSENRETYNNIIIVMRYMQANIQNKSGSEMKEVAETYLGFNDFNPNTKILTYSRNRTGGRASNERKNSVVESANIRSMKHCDFCRAQGHNKSTCPNYQIEGKATNS